MLLDVGEADVLPPGGCKARLPQLAGDTDASPTVDVSGEMDSPPADFDEDVYLRVL